MPLFKRVKLIADMDKKRRVSLPEQLGVNPYTFKNYLNEKRQHMLEPYIEPILALHPEISRHWLTTGEEPMLAVSDNADDQREQALLDELADLRKRVIEMEARQSWQGVDAQDDAGPLALTGFASCGMEGWGGTMTLAVPINPPRFKPGMRAVMAYGESMLPEGIGHGMVVWCDPSATPVPGECVYVEKHDKQAAIKKFLGRGKTSSGGGTIRLGGWRDRTGDKPQEPFDFTLDNNDVAVIAPVLYVQRRF
ncbi:helix-turn-helix transcriptional regulator [Desulfovibrio desulfuricans]|uniref:S24 family peptidase n=1 Tax=Desulfovibrio desulfuricans TaxID=876 RepID=UPI0017830E46|nr:helix-turn-helix transcriptional regulator [Desulfovibrio desulfuricans]MBD8896236.1 helix-turn-helix transcriptional regulator [Desulfovibrio desulfuricans]